MNSGEWFFRFFILDHFSRHAIHLNDWSEFPRPPVCGGLDCPKPRVHCWKRDFERARVKLNQRKRIIEDAHHRGQEFPVLRVERVCVETVDCVHSRENAGVRAIKQGHGGDRIGNV